MKTIKIGVVNAWWIGKKITCASCGSEFELDENDKDIINNQAKFDFPEILFECSICGKCIKVPNEEREELPQPPPPPPTRKQNASGAPILEKKGVSTGPNLAPDSTWGFLNDVMK